MERACGQVMCAMELQRCFHMGVAKEENYKEVLKEEKNKLQEKFCKAGSMNEEMYIVKGLGSY